MQRTRKVLHYIVFFVMKWGGPKGHMKINRHHLLGWSDMRGDGKLGMSL